MRLSYHFPLIDSRNIFRSLLRLNTLRSKVQCPPFSAGASVARANDAALAVAREQDEEAGKAGEDKPHPCHAQRRLFPQGSTPRLPAPHQRNPKRNLRRKRFASAFAVDLIPSGLDAPAIMPGRVEEAVIFLAAPAVSGQSITLLRSPIIIYLGQSTVSCKHTFPNYTQACGKKSSCLSQLPRLRAPVSASTRSSHRGAAAAQYAPDHHGIKHRTDAAARARRSGVCCLFDFYSVNGRPQAPFWQR